MPCPLLLPPVLPLYHFSLQDFHFTPGDEASREHHFQVISPSVKAALGITLGRVTVCLAPGFGQGEDRLQRIFYHLEGEVDDIAGAVSLTRMGKPLLLENIDARAREPIRLHPVLRLCDTRFIRRKRVDVVPLMVRESNSDDLTNTSINLCRN
ncbi:MAG: DUF2813 domain-containing protein [Symbiopectobacterium sp.]